ncbi:hypothetical protein EMIT0111MI5_150028 [Burkholderia sp. IT-111MI5]
MFSSLTSVFAHGGVTMRGGQLGGPTYRRAAGTLTRARSGPAPTPQS